MKIVKILITVLTLSIYSYSIYGINSKKIQWIEIEKSDSLILYKADKNIVGR